MQNFSDRVKSFEKELQELQDKYQLKMHVKIDFPLYKQLPAEVQLALKVIERHEGIIKTEYERTDINEDKVPEGPQQENKQ